MTFAAKIFHKLFASVSLGFVLLVPAAVPFPVFAGSNNNSSLKRDAASNQFNRAEELRAALNAKPSEKRTLAEYKQVVNSYRRVYLITPHAVQVPDALLAVAELNTEMGERFGRSYYQAAVESYQFLIREYPSSKYVPDAMLSVAQLQKDQLGDPAAATLRFQEFQKKYPHSPKHREVQEQLAELALLRNAETGQIEAKSSAKPNTSATASTANNIPAAGAVPPAPANVPSAAPTSPPTTITRQVAAESQRTVAKNGGESAGDGRVPRILQIKANAAANSTEVVIDLEESVQYSSGRIGNPDRIFFDLNSARLGPGVAHKSVTITGDLLKRVRVAQNEAGVVRVVLDVSGVQDYAASLVRKPTRLVIELYGASMPPKQEPVQSAETVPTARLKLKPTSPAPVVAPSNPVVDSVVQSQLASAETTDLSPAPATHTAVSPATVANDIPTRNTNANSAPSNNATTPGASSAPSTKSTPNPSSGSLTHAKSSKNGSKPDLVQQATIPELTRDGQSTLTRALGLKIGRIVIDAGHGGHDTGTIGPTGLMEKDLCLDVALRLGKLIQQKLPDTEIVYTRSDDTFIPLEERTRIANDVKADLFVSIHANSSPDHGARGVETYYLNLKGSPEAMEVAARENAVAQGNIHDLEDVVKKIARTEKIDESKELAEDVQDSLSKRIQKTAKPVKNRGVRKAPFVVLIGADMPSILTEISFLSNASDEQLLKKPEHRQRIAEGVFTGVTSYLQSMNSMNVKNTGRPAHPSVVSASEQTRSEQ